MNHSAGLKSLFAQKFDQAIFGVYFLGAIVPLIGMAFLAQRYVFPILEDQTHGVSGLTGLIVGIGALSLLCFFALRRITRSALAQIDADNDRLKMLLEMSRELSSAPHSDVIAATAARSAFVLLDASAAFLLIRSGPDKALVLTESVGKNAQELYATHGGLLQELVESAESQDGHATLCARECEGLFDDAHPISAVIAIKLRGETQNSCGALLVIHTEPGRNFSANEFDCVLTLSGLTSVALENARLQDTQRNFFSHVIEIMVGALDEHVDGRKGHAAGVAQLANRLGRELGLEGDVLQRLHFASLLHDIGMLKIARSKQLIPSEFRKHAALGHRMLSRIRLWEDIAPIVHHHHEYFDGSGYPEGLAGEQIPLESRVILVADAYDAMARSEGAVPARSLEEIVRELEQGAGGQFDPKVVSVFKALAERGEIHNPN